MPWPFTKQGDKRGYENNPNWTKDPASLKRHFPCGYWPTARVGSEIIPYEYWNSCPESTLLIGDKLYLFTSLEHFNLDNGPEEMRVVSINLETGEYTIEHSFLGHPAEYDEPYSAAFEIDGKLGYITTYDAYWDDDTFTGSIIEFYLFDGASRSLNRVNTESLTPFPTIIYAYNTNVRVIGSTVELFVTTMIDGETGRRLVRLTSDDFGASWVVKDFGTFGLNLHYVPCVLTDDGTNIHLAVSIFGTTQVAFFTYDSGSDNFTLRQTPFMSPYNGVVGFTYFNGYYLSVSKVYPGPGIDGTTDLDVAFARLYSIPGLTTSASVRSISEITIGSYKYLFLYIYESGVYRMYILRSSDGANWFLYDTFDLDSVYQPYSNFSLHYHAGTDSIVGTMYYLTKSLSDQDLTYNGVDQNDVSFDRPFYAMAWFQYKLSAQIIGFIPTHFIVHGSLIINSRYETMIPDQAFLETQTLEDNGVNPVWPLDKQKNKDASAKGRGFWNKT